MNQVVAIGDRLHIITRRLFSDDLRRHFVGEVLTVDGDLCEVRGFTFVYDTFKNDYVRYAGARVRVFGLGDAGQIVNKLPAELDVSQVRYRIVDGRLIASDGKAFTLEINEFGTKD